jgi:hypothetical protein
MTITKTTTAIITQNIEKWGERRQSRASLDPRMFCNEFNETLFALTDDDET